MFGYATNETDVLMPAPITYAHRLVQRQAEVRKNGTPAMVASGCKKPVTFQYDDGKIVGIDAVVLSTQHAEDIDQKSLQEAVMEEIIKPILPSEWLNTSTKFLSTQPGVLLSAVMGDCSLTGRKIIVDTYGGMARHGGGAFSGKIRLKLTVLQLTLRVVSRKTSWRQVWRIAVKSRSPTLSA